MVPVLLRIRATIIIGHQEENVLLEGCSLWVQFRALQQDRFNDTWLIILGGGRLETDLTPPNKFCYIIQWSHEHEYQTKCWLACSLHFKCETTNQWNYWIRIYYLENYTFFLDINFCEWMNKWHDYTFVLLCLYVFLRSHYASFLNTVWIPLVRQ